MNTYDIVKIRKEKQKMTENTFKAEDLTDIAKHGLIISGSIGSGKTTVAQHLFYELLKSQHEQKLFEWNTTIHGYEVLDIKVFDIIGNWRHLTPIDHQIIINEKTRENGIINTKSPMILTLNFSTFKDRAEIINAIVEDDYSDQKDLFLHDKPLHYQYVCFVEEANCIFNTKEVNKGFWLNFVATARNYNMVGIYTMQRLSDSSTKITERLRNFAFGMTMGDNDKRKIKAMISKEYYGILEFLEPYEFLCRIKGRYFILKLEDIQKYETDTMLNQWDNLSHD